MRLFVVVAGLAVGFSVVPFLIVGAPVESRLGVMQKIFYFHVPCAWLLLCSTLVAAAGSLLFLFRGSTRGDRFALASVELGVLFGLCTLVTGSLYARVAWGVFWTWDARLTSSLLLWLMLVAHLLARRYGGPGASRLAAALALFAAADVPLVYLSVSVWRTIHPSTTVVSTLGPLMAQVFWASVVLFCGLWGVLVVLRLRLEDARVALAELQLADEDRDALTADHPSPGRRR
jgi:heme exporter protein C